MVYTWYLLVVCGKVKVVVDPLRDTSVASLLVGASITTHIITLYVINHSIQCPFTTSDKLILIHE